MDEVAKEAVKRYVYDGQMPAYTGLDGTTECVFQTNRSNRVPFFPPVIGLEVGEESDGERLSYFKKDMEEGSSAILDKLILDGLVETRVYNAYVSRPDEKTSNAVRKTFYLMYKDKEASCYMPTVYAAGTDARHTKYMVTLEVKLAVNGEVPLSRYFTYKARKRGPYVESLLSHLENLESMLWEKCCENQEGFSYSEADPDFDYEESFEVVFFDGYGGMHTKKFESIGGLLDTVVSVRIIDFQPFWK